MFDSFAGELRTQLDALTIRAIGPNGAPPPRVETGRNYRFHYYDGHFNKLPKDWRFPRVGVLDAWRQWWIGDTVRSVPPLKNLNSDDVKFLDSLPLAGEELHARTGRFKENRRASRKVFADLKFLMEYMEKKVSEEASLPAEITITTVDTMYNVALPFICGAEATANGRFEQKKWISVVNELRKKLKTTAVATED
jgi:hypothetical protein